jgi:predicted metal-dependent phosphoesterase TrpH
VSTPSAGGGAGAGVSHHEFIDLHTHSTASDGARLPADVARAAKGAGLSAFALTDHDTVAGLSEARGAAQQAGIRLINGVELSAVEGDMETHILGLHLVDIAEIEQRLVELREMRVTRARRIVERLHALGVAITFEEVLKQAAGGAVGRPHIARALVNAHIVADLREAFDRYLGNGRSAFVPKDRLAIVDAIDTIHRAGGIAVLAHPGSLGTRERVAAMVSAGLDGLEVLHPSHSWDDSQRLDALATEFDLVRSGGSDWHGAPDGSRTLGMMRVPGQWLAAHEARAATIAARRVA